MTTLTPVDIVDRFYNRLWNRDERSLAPELLHPDLEFRGSVGLEVRGVEGFLGYMDRMLATFPDFSTEVLQLVDGADGTVVSRQMYRGTQQGAFFDTPPTGRRIEYAGVGFFEFEGGRIRKIWVLGDLLGLYRQLGWQPAAPAA